MNNLTPDLARVDMRACSVPAATPPPRLSPACSAFIGAVVAGLADELSFNDEASADLRAASLACGVDFYISARADEEGADQRALVRALLRAANRSVALRVPSIAPLLFWALERILAGWTREEALNAAQRVGVVLDADDLTTRFARQVASKDFAAEPCASELRLVVRDFAAALDQAGLALEERMAVLADLADAFEAQLTVGSTAPTTLAGLRTLADSCRRATQEMRPDAWSEETAGLVGVLLGDGEIDAGAAARLRRLQTLDVSVMQAAEAVAARAITSASAPVDEAIQIGGRALVLAAAVAAPELGERRETVERIALQSLDFLDGGLPEGDFERGFGAEVWAGSFVDLRCGRVSDGALFFARSIVEGLEDEAARWCLTLVHEVLRDCERALAFDDDGLDALRVFLRTGALAPSCGRPAC